MFAIPGIFGIVIFIFLRPQEAYPVLQRVPFLNLFFLLTIFGAAVDLRIRATKAIATPALPWVVGFYLWSLLTVGIMKSGQLVPSAVALFIVVAIFVLLSQSIQSFRKLEMIGMVLVALSMGLALMAIHQSLSPRQCIVAPMGATDHSGIGIPDGRFCVKARTCYDEQADPGADYICEKVGVLGAHAQGDRVRYRGVLQDPNELAAALSAGLAFLLALWIRRRNYFWGVLAIIGFAATAWAVKETGSRSGQLGFLGSLVIFLLWRFGTKVALILGPLCVPVLLFVASGGGGRSDADESSALRYEAWRAGLDMFRESPIWGVGFGQFVDRHFLTAHNTYVLILGELGLVGIYLFTMIIWLSFKTPIVAIRRYSGHPEAKVAEVWSVAVLASLVAILCGGLFLSFSYHYVLWIFLGISGGLFICIKRHDPDFAVQIRALDYAGVALVNLGIYVLIQLFLRLKGH